MRVKLVLAVFAAIFALAGGLAAFGAQVGLNSLDGSSAPPLSSAVPNLISIQGRLAKPSDGTPYTGSKVVLLKMFAAPSGGTELWSETQTMTLDANGFFDAFLGSVNPLPADLSDPLYVEMTVEGETLSPRTRITSSAFALTAGNGVPAGFSIVGDTDTSPPGFTFADTIPVGDRWFGRSRMQWPRSGAATASTGGKLYVIGGTLDGGVVTNVVEEYDPITDSWATKAPMPTSRYSLAAAAVNGKIYAIGGIEASNEYATVEEYDPSTDTWTTKTPMPTIRFSLGAAVVNGKIYAIGGQTTGPATAAVEEYDPVTDSWVTKASMLTARVDLGVVAVNNKVYAVGGSTNTQLEEYDPATNTWIPRASKLTNGRTSAVEYNGHLLAFTAPSSTLEEYDPIGNSWQSRSPLHEPSAYLVLGAVNGRNYVVGGCGGGCAVSANAEYVPLTTYYLHTKN